MIEVLPIDKLRPAADNVRRNVGDVDELAASIRAQGLLQALLVTPNGDGTYTVVAGHRRLEACKQAGVAEVNAEVREMDDRARVEAMLVENLQREDLSALEEAGAYQRLVDVGLSQRDIAERTGRSQAHVSKRLSLLTLPTKAIAALDSDRINLGEALELTKLAGHPKRVEEILGLVAGPYPTNVAREVANHLRRIETEEKIEASRKLLQSKKIKIVDYPGSAAWDTNAKVKILGTGYGRLDIKQREHSKLKCHAAAVHGEDGAIVYVCTDARSHAGAAAATRTEQAKAERAKTIARNKQVRAADAARAEAVAAILKSRVTLGDIVGLAARQLVNAADNQARKIACEFLGLDVVVDKYGTKNFRATLHAYLDDAGDNASTRVLLALTLGTGEVGARAGSYDADWHGTPHHLRWLQEHGYQLSELERETAATRRPKAVA